MRFELVIEHYQYGKRVLVFEDEETFEYQKNWYLNNKWKIVNQRILHGK